jgi:hypothetical protein
MNDFINNMKTFDKLIEFKDSFVKNGFYSKNFQEINELWSRSFGSVFKVKEEKTSITMKEDLYGEKENIQLWKELNSLQLWKKMK